MRGVIGAAFIILGLAGGYLILTGKFPPSAAAASSSSATTSTTTTGTTGTPSTPDGGPTGPGGAPVNVPGQVIGVAPHTAFGIPTMLSMSDQAASLGGFQQQ